MLIKVKHYNLKGEMLFCYNTFDFMLFRSIIFKKPSTNVYQLH